MQLNSKKRVKIILVSSLIILYTNKSLSQENKTTSASELQTKYNEVFHTLNSEIKNNGSFLSAVLLTENITTDTNTYSWSFRGAILSLSKLTYNVSHSIILKNYKSRDSLNYKLNLALNKVISDTINFDLLSANISVQPFTYNFNDPQGDSDWTNTFVTKLLATHKGNCRSLTYLYIC